VNSPVSNVKALVVFLLAAGVAAGIADRGAARADSPPFAIGLRVLRLVDHTRTIRLPGGRREARPLVTYVRYPALGAPSGNDLPDAPAARSAGPFPLVVFGHGYRVTPATYARLLRAWARAGYVVAAPVFPLSNQHAPGGPNEADLVNQPTDLRFVVSQLIAAGDADGDPLNGLIDPDEIAVAGHSDGADTALAAAYNRHVRDTRVKAAMIFSGAEMTGLSGYAYPPGSPALLAVQGTADPYNPPKFTKEFFDKASRPKFLLTLLRARHLPPFTYQQPQLGIVERVTVAFLDRYLEHGSLRELIAAGTAPGTAQLTARP
jgi:dienelactone hydrolase